jgi:hypothetical protein
MVATLFFILSSHVILIKPTWVATGIAGDSGRSFLQRFAFPVEGSAINAIFCTPEELGDALNNGKSFVANSRTLEYIPFKEVGFRLDEGPAR